MRRVTAVLAASLFLGNFLIASNAARDFEIIDGTVVAESCIRGTYRTGKVNEFRLRCLSHNVPKKLIMHKYSCLSSLLMRTVIFFCVCVCVCVCAAVACAAGR